MIRIGVLGIGEAGSAIAADLAAAGADVGAFDPADVPTPQGVERYASPEDLVQRREMIMSITAAVDAQAAIAQAWTELPRGAIYADLSTAPPTLKQDLNDTATLRGLAFADVALMSTVPRNGLATPTLVSGAGAAAYSELLTPLGARVEVVGAEPGEAATRKLLRSVVTKGLTAVVLEAMEGARRADLEDWMWAHIVDFINTADADLMQLLVDGTELHLERRIVEMESAAALLESVEVSPTMSQATERYLKGLREPDNGS